jgi:hypothetical protein
MYQEQELKAELARQNLSKTELAKMIQMQESTFLRKARSGNFYISEVERMANALCLSNERMCEIFFARKVS